MKSEDTKQTRIASLRSEILKLQNELNHLQEEEARLKESYRASDNAFNEIFGDNTDIFRQIVETANEGVWISDLNAKTIFLNQRMADMLGYRIDEMIGRSALDFLDEEGKAIAQNNLGKRTKGAKDVYEQKYIRKDGSFLWAMLSASPMYNNQKNVVCILGLLTDISDRKIMEEALKKNEQRLRATFNNAAIGIVEVDNQDRFINVNERICQMLGYSLEEFLGKTVNDITFYEDRDKSDYVNKGIHTGATRIHKYEKRYLKKDGSALWVHVTVSGVYDSVGRHINSIGTVEDISERKKVERALRESELRFRLLADNISQMAWISDKTGKPLWFNKRWYDYTGVSLEEMQNGGHVIVNDPNQSESVFKSFQQAINEGRVWKETYMMRSKTGEYRWFLSLASPVPDEHGEIQLWFGTSTDIHEQRKNEEILRSSEQRLAGIFNNAAIGIVELDTEMRFILVNNKVCEILGYSQDELLAKTMIEVTAPEDREHSQFLYNNLHKGNYNILNYEKRYQKKDGTKFWVQISVSAIRDAEGKHLRSIGTVKDINERKLTDDRLREALKNAEEGKNILQALMEYIPMGITIADAPDAKIRMVSRYGRDLIEKPFEAIVGYTVEDHTESWGIYYMDGVTPARIEDLPLGRTVQKGEVIRNEEWIITRSDGKKIPVLCNSAPILNKDGKITGGVMGWQDITESRKLMQELMESEQRYRTVIESADLGTWDFDIETGVAIHSFRHDQIFGYSEPQPEWSYEISVKHIFPEYHHVVRNAVARAIETGVLEYDAKIKWPDGSVHWIGPRGRVLYSAEGKPLRMTGIVADITDRKMAEEALRESEEKFRSLFENITEGVALYEVTSDENITDNYRLIDANPAYRQFPVFETQNEFYAHDITRNDQLQYFGEFINVARSRQPFRFETSFPGINKHFIINVISPKKGQFATVLEDITEQKKIEHELKQKNEELTRFIYTVSHDLKSPLVTIKSFTSYLKEDIALNDVEAQDKDVSFIQNAVDRMGKLLDELLELSRIGRKEVSKTEVPLREVAQTVLDLLAGQMLQTNIEVKFSGPPVMLFGHMQRLIQLYQNLIDNAAKFMGSQPHPLIEIGAFPDGTNKDQIIMFVRDNGSGIDPKYHHKLFGLFEKLDNSTEGTGIGLALVKRIVEVHGGTVWFESEGVGKGSTFYFTLDGTRLI